MEISNLLAITCILCAVIFYLHVAALADVALWVRFSNALPIPSFLAAWASVFVTGRIVDVIIEIVFLTIASAPVTLIVDKHIKLRNTAEGNELIYRLRYWFIAVALAIALIITQLKCGTSKIKPIQAKHIPTEAITRLDSLNQLKR